MKQIMQIIGAKVITPGSQPDQLDATVEIYLIPWNSGKVKRPSLFQMAMGGINIEDLTNQAKATETKITILHVSLGDWIDVFHNKILTQIEIDLNPTIFHGEE